MQGIDDDEKIGNLEKQFDEAQGIASEADKRYDESSRRFAIMEIELETTEDRADAAETKLAELEEELRTVGNNMKMLEISEQDALSREETYDEQIRDLSARLKAVSILLKSMLKNNNLNYFLNHEIISPKKELTLLIVK